MGRTQFSKGIAVIVTEAVSFSIENEDQVAAVAVAATEDVDIYAPTNSLCQVDAIKLACAAPAGAASGDHSFYLMDTGGVINYAAGTSGFAALLRFDYGEWVSATSIQRPTDDAGTLLAVQRIRFDDTVGLRVRYHNNSDVEQTNARTIRVALYRQVIG